MLKTSTNALDLLARLDGVPDAVQASVQPALAVLARSATPTTEKSAAIGAQAQQVKARRLRPDRGGALARFGKPDGRRSAEARLPLSAEAVAARLKQAAVQGALTALGRR